MTNAIIPDISMYQDDNTTLKSVNFEAMKAAHASGVIIRAGQNLWTDPDFKDYWMRSREAGLPRGSYWFYDSRVNPKRQAELWIQTLADDQGELPLFADFEDTYKGDFDGWKNWHDFLERLKQLAPEKEIFIYTGYFYWFDAMVGVPVQSQVYFKQYPLWIAAYLTEAPRVPTPWNMISNDAWTFWQYTDKGDGALYGVESKNIDLNYYHGDAAAFTERFHLDYIPDNGGGGEEPMTYRVTVVWDQGASVKNGPNTGGAALKVFADGESFIASEFVPDNTDANNPQKKWARIAEGTYKDKYVAVLYPSSSGVIERCTWIEINPPPDPEPSPTKPIKVLAEVGDDNTAAVSVTLDPVVIVTVSVNGKKYVPES